MGEAAGRAGGRRRRGEFLSGAAVAVGCLLFLGGFVVAAVLYQPYAVPTDSMAPTVSAGDRVLARRIDGDEVRRGDVVIFSDATWGDSPMIKRVIGIGGDTVACCTEDGRVTVNGEPVSEPYLGDESREATGEFEAEVPEGELFLLGDNRVDSLDSRSMLSDTSAGSVSRDAVSARVEAVVWPLSRVGLLEGATGFAALPGGVSGAGPLRPLAAVAAAGVLLVAAGGAYGPLSRRVRARGRRSVSRSPVTHNEGTHG